MNRRLGLGILISLVAGLLIVGCEPVQPAPTSSTPTTPPPVVAEPLTSEPAGLGEGWHTYTDDVLGITFDYWCWIEEEDGRVEFADDWANLTTHPARGLDLEAYVEQAIPDRRPTIITSRGAIASGITTLKA